MIITFTDNGYLARMLEAVDKLADDTRNVFVSRVNPLKLAEYQRAETVARAFKAAAYGGEVPQAVLSWAEAKGWSAQQACDDIIAQADAWYAALDAIRDVRLKTREAMRQAAGAAELDALHAQGQQAFQAILNLA